MARTPSFASAPRCLASALKCTAATFAPKRDPHSRGALLETAPRIDVLVNNASAFSASRGATPDGLGLTFAPNHMGYFRLTALLRERLIASALARVVATLRLKALGG